MRKRLHSLIYPTVVWMSSVPHRVEASVETLPQRGTSWGGIVAAIKLQSLLSKQIKIRGLHVWVPIATHIRVGHVVGKEKQQIRLRTVAPRRGHSHRYKNQYRTKHIVLENTKSKYHCLLLGHYFLAHLPKKVALTESTSHLVPEFASLRPPHRCANLYSCWMEICILGRDCRPSLL